MTIASLQGQDADRFAEELSMIRQRYDTVWDPSKETIVFTGSSSIRIWKDLQDRFPHRQIINTGFGGSQTSDLLAHLNPLVLRFRPKKVFIYEGDNDLAASKPPREILIDTREVVRRIRAQDSLTQIILIAAKPSLARWDLKRKYKKLNRTYKRMGKREPFVLYADIWKPMLEGRKPRKELFLEDGLHMNDQGYALWYAVLKEHLPLEQ